MRKFGKFKGYICTANDDGAIPLNSKCAVGIYERDEGLLKELIAQANLAYDLRMAMSESNTQTEQFKAAFERYQKALEIPF